VPRRVRRTTPPSGSCASASWEALSRKVYDHAELTPPEEPEPKVSDTKTRLDRYIAARLPGSDNERLRRYARTTIELAQDVKHRTSPTRTEAGIAADAVIVLANIVRRLDEGNDLIA
jgi:hypothetical protein